MSFFSAKALYLCRSLTLHLVGLRNSSSAPKVALIGAAGGIGQPLALLLKANKLISRLALYDIDGTAAGVAADLSHIDSPAQVTGHVGPEQLHGALQGADIVVCTAGVARKSGMTDDDIFNANAGVVRDLAEQAANICPKAFLVIITNPVNSTVPIAAEVYKSNDVFDPRRIFGVTTLDIVRSHSYEPEFNKLPVTHTEIPVIGGHSGVAIVPLLSQASVKFSEADCKALTQKIQAAGAKVVKAKAASATLSMANAGARFVEALVKALNGERSVCCAYVKSNVVKGADYFASAVELGPSGAEKVHGYGTLSKYEEQLVQAAIAELQRDIEQGVKFIKQH